MKPIKQVLFFLLIYTTVAFSYINEAYQCPGLPEGSHEREYDCIMVGGMPCMATTIPGVCEGEPDPNHPEWGPVAWWSVSDGTEKCNCPYTLANKCYGKYDDPNFCPRTVCIGTTIKKNGRCDPKTGGCAYDEGYCEFGCNAEGTDCALEKPAKPSEAYQKGDGICSITLGERCDNSPQDCICIGGKSCKPNAQDADDAGCARDINSECGDEYHYCDTAAGENCATCSSDCKCDAGYVCNPTSADANYMGCARIEAKTEEGGDRMWQ